MGTERSFSSAGASSMISEQMSKMTKILLACGVFAGPLYLSVALIQGLTREGFDFTHHSVSLLSNGDLGWIQIANFLLTGLLVIAGAAGMQRAIPSGRGKRWGPLLVGIYGFGLVGAGIFVADPANGFPPGAPADTSQVSVRGLLHFLSGGVGFLALSAACFVFASRFASLAQRNWAVYSMATGIIFFAAFAGIASGSAQSWTVVGFWIGVVLAWIWLSLIAARLMGVRGVGKE